MDLHSYLETAKKAQGYKSDAKLADGLGVNKSMITYYRAGRAWPDDETMTTLADLANVKREQALLELSAWRTSGAARKTYEGLLKALAMAGKITAAALALVFLLTATAPTVHASVYSGVEERSTIYIMRQIASFCSGAVRSRYSGP